MDKQEVINKYFEKLNELKVSMTGSLEAYKQASVEAPGAMESHSDTSKFQFGLMSEKIAEELYELDKALGYKFGDDAKVSESINIGSLVEIEEEGKSAHYFIVPAGGGGHKLTLNDETIVTLSPNSPLGEISLNKKVGDLIDFTIGPKSRKLKIVSIT